MASNDSEHLEVSDFCQVVLKVEEETVENVVTPEDEPCTSVGICSTNNEIAREVNFTNILTSLDLVKQCRNKLAEKLGNETYGGSSSTLEERKDEDKSRRQFTVSQMCLVNKNLCSEANTLERLPRSGCDNDNMFPSTHYLNTLETTEDGENSSFVDPEDTKIKLEECIITLSTQFPCEGAGETITSNELVNQHENICNEPRILQCEFCKERFEENVGNTENKEIQDKKRFCSKRCEETFFDCLKVSNPIETIHEETSNMRFVPNIYGFEAHRTIQCVENQDKTKLQEGKLSYPGPSKEPVVIDSRKYSYKCEVCKREFKRLDHLKDHMRIHTGEVPFDCKMCEKKYTRRSLLKEHMKKHTGENLYTCEQCEKTFVRLSHLKIHVRTHTGEQPYGCEQCGKRFYQSCHLKDHMKVHTGIKPYECEFCQHKFSGLKELKRHYRVHTGEKPFMCELCGNKFGDSSTLRQHIRRHTGEKPYNCQFCNKSFAKISVLNVHARVHTGERPFQCHLCEMKFSYTTSLKRHVKIHTQSNSVIPVNNVDRNLPLDPVQESSPK